MSTSQGQSLSRVGVAERNAVPRPERIPDTFLRLPKGGRKVVRETEPILTISRNETYGKGGCRVMLSSLVKRELGLESGHERNYVQLFVSASTIKLALCEKGAPDARMVAGDGYISARELGEWFQLEHGESFRCKAEVVKSSKMEVWATFPQDLRDRIGELNGAIR